MVFTIVNQHYFDQLDTMYKICYKIKNTVNYISQQLKRYIDES